MNAPAAGGDKAGDGADSRDVAEAATKPPPRQLNVIQKTYRSEALARLQRAAVADYGFVERLVLFWSNHFCVSANKGGWRESGPARSSARRSGRMCSAASATC